MTVTALELRSIEATRYCTPLREGGSLPAIVEADDEGLYVVKFRGAGQGAKALVAELLTGELARALDLPVPEIVLAEIDPDLARAEPDPEIQDLIAASAGTNVALDFLPGALAFDVAAGARMDPDVAAAVVWIDALVMNVDRTPRNPNLLVWHGRVWLIDHGAALYLQHGTEDLAADARRPFPAIADHVLLPFASSITDADARLAPRVTPELVTALADAIPDAWLADPERERAAYAGFLRGRLDASRGFAEEAEAARGRA